MATIQPRLVCVIALLTAATLLQPQGHAATTAPPVRFGLDLASIDAQAAAGLKPSLGMTWIGPWTLKSGWGGPDALFEKAYRSGVTPVVQFYYWGNDISKACIDNGCWSTIHSAWKSRAGWDTLAQQLADHLSWRLHGAPAYIVIETEFNKGDAARYETLDGLLEAKARYFDAKYANARTVLGFGNWDRASWATFDRAAAASDLVGLQGLRGAPRNSYESYVGLADATLAGAKELQWRFHKPILLTDIGASSHWEPEYLKHQATAVGRFFDRLGDLQAAGVQGIVYRSFRDSPGASTREYFGESERHWGLAWADGTPKSAWTRWRDGVSSTTTGTTSTSSLNPRAPTTTTTPLSVEVERFAQRPVGGAQPDATASAGSRWSLWANGRASQPVDFATPGTYEIRVKAQGQILYNVAPHLNLYLDGQKLLGADPWSGGWKEYAARVRVDAVGPHTVHVEFTNDARSTTGDRNLLLDRVQVAWVSA